MKKYDFGIRVEMGGKIGSGHFFRCLAIGEELRKRGKTIIFLTSNKEKFNDHYQGKNTHILLKEKIEKNKIIECKKLMNKIKCLIIDLPKNEEKYGKELEKEKIIIINDIGKEKIFSNILINGSIVKKFHKYQIKNKSTKLFLGSKYTIIRKEFVKIRKNVKIERKSIKNVLITFGGNDEKNMTIKILKFLLGKKINITIILGPTNYNTKNISNLIKNKTNAKIIINPKNVAKLFSNQDLVISSTGITIYELACLGIPTIMIPINSAQKESAKEMEKRGFGKIIDSNKLNLKKLEQTYLKFDDLDYRKKMFKSGRKIIDGKGVERIGKIMEKII
jgi:UDP-2,4-diacetamido-2,4,6-trideoxy-beta-L-altropyranose hydrolase